MNILINCSNIKIGGGIQVALSFLDELVDTNDNNYIVIVSSVLRKQLLIEKFAENFKFYFYDMRATPIKTIFSINPFLDGLVIKHQVTKVFTIFGPSYWRPKVTHICGYAKPHYIYKDSPFFNIISAKHKIQLKLKEFFHILDFKKNADVFITENPDVSKKLKLLVGKDVNTVTNTYNQIFDDRNQWKEIKLPDTSGKYLLTITANYPHKNMQIIPLVIQELLNRSVNNFKFVITLNKGELTNSNAIIDKYILYLGRVNVDECPSLYEQCDYLFLPTLLECFSASYAEAMKMDKIILTSDLDFARGICQDAAMYFDPLDPINIVDQLLKIESNIEQKNLLKSKGKLRLASFDTAKQRAIKYLEIIENS